MRGHKHGIRVGGLRESHWIGVSASMFSEMVADIIEGCHRKETGGCGESEAGQAAVRVPYHVLAKLDDRLERLFDGGLSLGGGSGDVEGPGFGNPGERPNIAESEKLAIRAHTPGREGSGKTIQFFGLHLKSLMTSPVEEDVVVYVPIVRVSLPVCITQYESDEKDVASCQCGSRNTVFASKADEVLTYDRGLYITAGNIHLTTIYHRLAVRLASPLPSIPYRPSGQ